MNWSALLWLVLLLLANGFFVSAEFAYITARRNILEQIPRRSAQIAVSLNKNLTLSLAAAQLGITMASLVLGAVAEPAVATIFEMVLGPLPISENVIHWVSLLLALLIVVFYYSRIPWSQRLTLCGLGLIMGGALGNGIDRYTIGQVIDFLDVYFGDYHWPAFNVADSAICIGVGLLLIDSFRRPAGP